MFAAIGRIADRYRYALLAGWILAAILVTLFAPNLDDVTSNEQSDWLPDDASSITAQKMVERYFPQQVNEGAIVLVFDAGPNGQIQDDTNMGFIADVSQWLTGDTRPDHIRNVISPALNPEAAGAMISPDGQVGMVMVLADTHDQKLRADLLDSIGNQLKASPDGLDVYRTGEIAINHEYNDTLTRSVDRTIFVTLVLVVLILLMIYRSPVSPLIPLFVVTIAFMIARGIVAWLAQSVMSVSDTAVMLLIVVMYGAGTDYCLFLISRFREEMADSKRSSGPTRRTVQHVGESISSSAGTVIVGFTSMALAKLGLFNTTGPTLAVGVIVSLLAGLTLTPAILSLLGKRAFWPAQPRHRNSGALYKRTSQWVSSRPLLTILIIVTAMAPLAYYGSRIQVTYDFLADLPDDTESVEGFRVLEQHIGAGEMQPLTAVAIFEDGDVLAQVETMTRELETVDGVAAVRSATQPLGSTDTYTNGITRLDHQLNTLATLLTPQPDAGVPTPEQQAMMQGLMTDLPAYLALVAERAPELAQNPAYTQLVSGDTTALPTNLSVLAEAAPDVHLMISELPTGVATVLGGEPLAGLIGGYLNGDARAARFEIVLDDAPYSLAALDTAERLDHVLDRTSDHAALQGPTVVVTDMRHFLQIDQRLTISLVLLGIFLILLVMLRSVIAPMYLIGTILLSYRATLGITRIASDLIWGTDKLTWWVPFFMFVFLVALGIDYSIFLFGRIKEEVGRRGAHEGIHHAVQSTGSIITSAGVIVAGTFGAMMAGDILGLAQIGFAVSVGILIDTFIVRTVLDPALATVFGRWTWWPGGIKSFPVETDHATPLPQPSGSD
jgi:RND superfamily putative drug exporter